MTEASTPTAPASGSAISRLLSDDRLALRATKGDRRAFAAIFRRYHQSLYRFCLAIVGNPEDAQDALQNTMVKVLRALPGEERRIELKPWLYRIAHNESIELLRRRRDTRLLDPELPAPGPGLADDAASRERLRRLISDLDELPERQRGTLVMRELAGLDFAEIGAALGTSSAVARQTLYEARLSLRQMDEGREMSCEAVAKALSDGDGRVTRRRDLRAHLRSCAGCRRFREEIEGRERDLAALAPLPALAAAGLLQGLLGGHGAAGGGLAGALGGGAAKSFGASAALKGAATVAVVAAIGATAADRGGLIHVGLPGDGGSQATRAEQPAGAGSAGAQPTQAGAAAVSATARSAAGAKGAGHLGASQAAKTAAGKAASPEGKTNAEAAPAPTSQNNSVAHPHGKRHERQLPSASAHGQQTAASHKTANHGTAGTQRHPAHPSKPTHPVHPSNPSAEKGPSSPPSSAVAPETHAHGNVATQAAGAEETSPDRETGKKP
jgi:RNA polymerase sigma factor (sigma-70 family)